VNNIKISDFYREYCLIDGRRRVAQTVVEEQIGHVIDNRSQCALGGAEM
jgi:hypothetical protein